MRKPGMSPKAQQHRQSLPPIHMPGITKSTPTMVADPRHEAPRVHIPTGAAIKNVDHDFDAGNILLALAGKKSESGEEEEEEGEEEQEELQQKGQQAATVAAAAAMTATTTSSADSNGLKRKTAIRSSREEELLKKRQEESTKTNNKRKRKDPPPECFVAGCTNNSIHHGCCWLHWTHQGPCMNVLCYKTYMRSSHY